MIRLPGPIIVWSASSMGTSASVPSGRRYVSLLVRTPVPSNDAATSVARPVVSRRYNAINVAATDDIAHR